MLGGLMVQNSEEASLRCGWVHRRGVLRRRLGIQLPRSQVFCSQLGYVLNRVYIFVPACIDLLPLPPAVSG